MNAADEDAIRRKIEAWITVADADRQAASVCLAVHPPISAIAAYHCQQAAEKLLKGFLVRAGVDFGKTHDLAKLGHAVTAAFPGLAVPVGAVKEWTIWNVAYRYPMEEVSEPEPSPGELRQALAIIDRLAASLRTLASTKVGD
jgi:HEPN domain-containing protein